MEIQNNLDLYLSIFGGTFLILLFAIAVILFFVVYRKRLFEQELALEKKESQHRLQLLRNSIEITEKERKRIASDLHDEIGSHLSAIRILLNAIQAKSTLPDIQKLSHDSKVIIDRTLGSVRTISHNLLPPGLDTFGLLNILSDLCQKITDSSGTQISFSTNNSAARLTPEIELALYRMVQELISNSIKHAAPKNIQIEIGIDAREVCLHYRDDGKGLEGIPLKNHKGLGMRNIESRTLALNGKLDLSTQPGSGFSLQVKIPLLP